MPDVTAAAFPIPIGDKTYMMSPLSDRDIEELNNWFRADIVRVARLSLSDDMTVQERAEVLDVAMQRASKFTWYGPDARDIMGNVSAIARVVWMGLRKNHPELTVDVVQKALFDPSNLDATLVVWRQLNTGAGTRDEPGGTPKGKARRRSRSTRR